jgi:CheY-like chemotaxis protein
MLRDQRGGCRAEEAEAMSDVVPQIAPASSVRERPPPAYRRGPRLVTSGRRVLLVEDNPLTRRSTARALALELTVTTANDAEEAQQLFRRGAFDVVVSDHHMPAMTGLELLEHVRMIDPRVRRVLVSGSELPGIEGHVASGLVHLWLLKPVDLRAALQSLLARPSA